MDVAGLGLYSHRLQWLRTTTPSPQSTLAAAYHAWILHSAHKVVHILEPNRTSLPVVKDDLHLLASVKKMGLPRRAFSTFMNFPQSFAFRDRGPDMVWDAHTQSQSKPSTDKHERAMGFLTGTTTTFGLLRANDGLCWAKPWILTPWCGLLVYVLHCKGIVVTSCCLWGHRNLVRGAHRSTSIEERGKTTAIGAEHIF